jgi:hypothetical protein
MEWQLFEPGTVPEHTTVEWYASRDRAPHLEEGLHRGRLLLTAKMVNDAVRRYGVTSVSDMGCGDGGLLSLLDVPAWGYDLQPSNVAGGKERGVDVRLGDALSPDVQWADLAVCTEMLEHLVDPHGFLAAVPSRVVVASSPRTESDEYHYPFHTWAWNEAGYPQLFSGAGFKVVRHEFDGMFQIVMAVRP